MWPILLIILFIANKSELYIKGYTYDIWIREYLGTYKKNYVVHMQGMLTAPRASKFMSKKSIPASGHGDTK